MLRHPQGPKRSLPVADHRWQLGGLELSQLRLAWRRIWGKSADRTTEADKDAPEPAPRRGNRLGPELARGAGDFRGNGAAEQDWSGAALHPEAGCRGRLHRLPV